MIRLRSFSKTYVDKSKKKVNALVNVDLFFPEKGLHFILGKSGSGKSTILNILSGIDNQTSGNVEIYGEELSMFSTKRINEYRCSFVGLVFQDYNLINSISIYDNLALSLRMRQIAEEDIKIKIENILDEVGLKNYQDKFPYELSGGERQRVAIARAIIKDAKMILADEPTGALDSENSKSIFEILKKISNERLVIVVSHDRDSAYTYGSRVIELSDGRVIADNLKDDNIVDKGELKLTNGKLPFKTKMKFSLKNLKIKRFRLALNLLLATVSLVLFALMDSIGGFSFNGVVYKGMNKWGIDFVSFEKYSNMENFYDDADIAQYDYNFNEDDFSFFKEKFSKNTVRRKFIIEEIFFEEYIDKYETIDDKFDSLIYEDAIELDGSFLEDFNAELVAGRFPLKNKDVEEICVPKRLFDLFEEKGYLVDEKVKAISSYNDFIGLIFPGISKDYQIVGIIDTKCDTKRYEPLKDAEIDYDYESQLMEEKSYYLQSGIHTVIFTRPGYYEECVKTKGRIIDNPFYFTNKNQGFDFPVFEYINDDYLGKYETVYWKDGIKRDSLKGNEIVISSFYLYNVGIVAKNKYYENEVSEKITNMVLEYVEENYDKVKDEFEAFYGEGADAGSYASHIIQNNEGKFDDKDYYYFRELATIKTLEEFGFPLLSSIVISEEKPASDTIMELFNGTFEVVGVYRDYDGSGTFCMSDENYEIMSKAYPCNDVKRLLVSFSSDNKANKELVFSGVDTFENEIGDTFVFDNEIKSTLSRASDVLSATAKICMIFAILLIVFFSFFLFNYIATGISVSRKNIGVMQSMGVDNKDIMDIFVFEGLMISLTSLVFSVILSFISLKMINVSLMMEFRFSVELYYLGFRQIGIMLLVCLLLSGISSVVPIILFARKKTIDVIKRID